MGKFIFEYIIIIVPLFMTYLLAIPFLYVFHDIEDPLFKILYYVVFSLVLIQTIAVSLYFIFEYFIYRIKRHMDIEKTV